MTPTPPTSRTLEPLGRGLLRDNPVLCHALGICSALAVTGRVGTAAVMGGCLMVIAAASCLLVSLLRNLTPRRVRMITQVVIIATLVSLIDLLLEAWWFEMSQALGVYVGLIVTNCIIMGRCESYASCHRPLAAGLDGLASGLGYAIVLLAIAAVRETLGAGTLAGWRVMPAGYLPNGVMASAPGAFLTMGVLVWVARAMAPPPAQPAGW